MRLDCCDTVRSMLIFLLCAGFVAYGASGQFVEGERCDGAELNACVDMIPKTPVGLPRNRQELDAHCSAYQTGMSCMDAWMKKCLPTDGQRLVQQQIGGARALMRYLCNETTSLRKEFLSEPRCWSLVSSEWSRCGDELQLATRDVTQRAMSLPYVNKNAELCCARDAFLSCVTVASRACSASAAALLRRLALVLAQDVAACSNAARARCSAPSIVQHAASGSAFVALLVALIHLVTLNLS